MTKYKCSLNTCVKNYLGTCTEKDNSSCRFKQLENRATPKSPEFFSDGYDSEGEPIVDMWRCPSCEALFEVEYDEYEFCPDCGQRIDRK